MTSCTLCGSQDWPRPDATCPLCRGEEEERDPDYEYDLSKENENNEIMKKLHEYGTPETEAAESECREYLGCVNLVMVDDMRSLEQRLGQALDRLLQVSFERDNINTEMVKCIRKKEETEQRLAAAVDALEVIVNRSDYGSSDIAQETLNLIKQQ